MTRYDLNKFLDAICFKNGAEAVASAFWNHCIKQSTSTSYLL